MLAFGRSGVDAGTCNQLEVADVMDDASEKGGNRIDMRYAARDDLAQGSGAVCSHRLTAICR